VKRHFISHNKGQLVYVLQGNVAVTIDNIEQELKAGDSVYLKEAMPTLWQNRKDREAELLLFCL